MIKIKKILFILMIGGLFLPLIQLKLSVFEERELKGVFENEAKPTFTWLGWREGVFQNSFQKNFNDSIGFKSFFVGLNNQISLDFFNVANAYGLFPGKEGYFFGDGYLEQTYSGDDFLGVKKIDSLLTKVKYTQNLLKKQLNIDLIIGFAPSKEFVLPEFIPDYYANRKGDSLNIDWFVNQSRQLKINHIDFNQVLREIKDTSEYPVFYKRGEHWSHYSMILAGKHLINYIENLRGIDMPDFYISGIEHSDTARYVDNDQGNAMNLLFESNLDDWVYPQITFDVKNKTKPNVLAIADCYYQQFHKSLIADNCFKNKGKLWFYNRQEQSKETGYRDIVEVNKYETIIEQDVIIYMFTNQNLKDFGHGFFDEIEQLVDKSKFEELQAQKKKERVAYLAEVEQTIERIKGDVEWYAMIKRQAVKRGMTTEKMLERSAKYIIDNR